MTAIEYLIQLREAKFQYLIFHDEIDEPTMKVSYGTGRYIAKTSPARAGRSKMEASILDQIELKIIRKEYLAKQNAIECGIIKVIYAVLDKAFQSTLQMRYMRYYRQECIAEEMDYSLDYVYELHGKTLQCVQVQKNAKNCRAEYLRRRTWK